MKRSYHFAYSATLRIAGNIKSMDEISHKLELQPTHTHLKGERRFKKAKPYKADMWSYKVPVPEDRPLSFHIYELWSKIRSKKEYLNALKKELEIDVFLGYRTDCETAGLEVPHSSLEMFVELDSVELGKCSPILITGSKLDRITGLDWTPRRSPQHG